MAEFLLTPSPIAWPLYGKSALAVNKELKIYVAILVKLHTVVQNTSNILRYNLKKIMITRYVSKEEEKKKSFTIM